MSVFHFKKFDVINEKSALKVNTDAVLLGAIVPLLGNERTVLDIGTGTGVIALMLAQRLCDIRSRRTISLAFNEASAQISANSDEKAVDDLTIEKGRTQISTAPNSSELRTQPFKTEATTQNCANAETLNITGIDIDRDAAEEAKENFAGSPWRNILKAENCSLNDWQDSHSDSRYDIIVSNPPYFDSSLTNPEARKSTARHTGEDESGLSYREIMEYARTSLTESGKLAVILPADQEAALLRYGRMCRLLPIHIARIRTVERKKPSRIVITFSKKATTPDEVTLTMMNQGKYTDQYISLVKDFYLFA